MRPFAGQCALPREPKPEMGVVPSIAADPTRDLDLTLKPPLAASFFASRMVVG